jgi:hypothetical protein
MLHFRAGNAKKKVRTSGCTLASPSLPSPRFRRFQMTVPAWAVIMDVRCPGRMFVGVWPARRSPVWTPLSLCDTNDHIFGPPGATTGGRKN